MWEVTRKGLLAHKFRLLLTSISIVLGVGFVAGTLVFTDTIGSVFDHLFTQTTSGTDAVVRARLPFKVSTQSGAAQDRAPVPDGLVPVVRSAPGVAEAQGSVSGYALVVGKDGKAVEGQAPTLGVSWGPIPRFAKSFNVEKGRRPTQADEVGIDETTASKAKLNVGDRVRIVFLTVPPQEFTVSAVFKFGDAGNLAGATLAAFEPTTAQRLLNKVGVWDEVDAAATSGLSQTQLRDRLSATLQQAGVGNTYEAITQKALAQETANNIKQGLSFFNTFLLIFALVALFVGAFIIYNTFSIIVAQRARELGLLKAIG
ncbi:MAG: ABC transporter permease, partial [Acidimicrobiia bacterium]|nr:ABC transporter permease [Acidimicrobiia bacterium]